MVQYRLEFGRNAAVKKEELAVDETGQWEAVEHIHGEVIGLLVVLAKA
jgi:hypothetical protein